MYKRLTALLAAAVMLSAAVPLPAAAQEEKLPDWVPQSYTEAMHFANEFGRTHTADGYVCMVQRKETDLRHLYQIEWDEGAAPVEPVFQETFAFEGLPEKPDRSDSEAYTAYLEALAELGISEYEAEHFTISTTYTFEVTVFQPDEDLAFTWVDHNLFQTNADVRRDYAFSVQDGAVTETDLWSWVPDCVTEFHDYQEQHDTVEEHEGYVAFCDDIATDGGYSLIASITGTARMELLLEEQCTPYYLLYAPDGTPDNVFRLYQPLSHGTVSMSFTQAREWDLTDLVAQDVKYYAVDRELAVTEITEAEQDVPLPGDCNNDGTFDTLDIVMLQKYVHGLGELTAWWNADLDGDEIIDIYDLALMRRSLLMQQAGDPEEIPFETCSRVLYRLTSEDNELDYRYFKAALIESPEQLQEALGDAEQSADFPEIDFGEKCLIMVQTSVSGSSWFENLEFDSIERIGSTVTISPVIDMPDPPTPDMAYWKFFLLADRRDLEGVSFFQIHDVFYRTEET